MSRGGRHHRNDPTASVRPSRGRRQGSKNDTDGGPGVGCVTVRRSAPSLTPPAAVVTPHKSRAAQRTAAGNAPVPTLVSDLPTGRGVGRRCFLHQIGDRGSGMFGAPSVLRGSTRSARRTPDRTPRLPRGVQVAAACRPDRHRGSGAGPAGGKLTATGGRIALHD